MPPFFTDKYLKGYEFDHKKIAKSYGCEPYSDEAYNHLNLVQKLYRRTYIAVGLGRTVEEHSRPRVILVLASGDDYEKLKNTELKDLHPWFSQAMATTLTGPHVYINEDVAMARFHDDDSDH